MNNTNDREYTVEALDNGITVLFALGTPQYIELSLKELAESLDMPANKVYRILWTLERRQLVEQMDGKWRIAPAITRFSEGYRRWLHNRRAELERTELEHIGRRTEERHDDDTK